MADSDGSGQGSLNLGGFVELGGGDVSLDVSVAGGQLTGAIGGSGGLIKHGTGTLTITPQSVNTFTGATVVTNGTLIVNGALDSGGVAVYSGATLSGNGHVAGGVEVFAGGKLAPGASVGVLHVGNLLLHSGATVEFDVMGLSAGATHDQLVVSGTVQLDGAKLVAVSGQFSAPKGTTIVLIDNDGADALTGLLFSASQQPLPQGSPFPLGGATVDLRYDTGVGANDLGLLFTQQTFFFTDLGSESGGNSDSGLNSGAAGAGLGATVASEAEPAEPRRSTLGPANAEQANLAAESAAAQTVRLGSFENAAQSRLRVFFRLYNDALDQEDKREYPLPVENLSDVLAVFRRFKFPNGHYRVYVQEAGARVERLLLDVHVYEGRVVAEGFREEEGTPRLGDGVAPPTQSPNVVDPPRGDADEEASGEVPDARPDEQSRIATPLTSTLAVGAVVGGYVMGQATDGRRRQIHHALAVGRRATSKLARRLSRIRPR